MSTSKITVQITDPSSNQDFTTDPDMIEISLTREFLQKAEKCLAFMQENEVSYICLHAAFGYTLYELSDNLDEDDKEGQALLIGTDGQEYAVFDPEYRLDGCHAKIYQGGYVQAVFPFKDSCEELWADVGLVADLKLKF